MRFAYGFLMIPLLAAQNLPAPAVRGPVMGWVFDSPAGALRPLWGVPGAALLGAPLASPALEGAAVSPRQDYALVTGAAGETAILRLPEAVPLPLAGAAASPSRIAFSPTGAATAFYSDRGRVVQVATGLPDAPSLAARPYPDGLPAPAALAVSDDGAAVLAAAGGTLLLLGAGDARPLPVPGSVSALAFLTGTHDAAAASASGEVWLIAAAGEEPRYRMVAGAVAAPLAVAFSRDGARVFVAGASGAAAVDVASGLVSAIPCRCSPTGLQRLNGDSLFLLTTARPVFVLDGSGPAPRTWIVPPSTAEEEQ